MSLACLKMNQIYLMLIRKQFMSSIISYCHSMCVCVCVCVCVCLRPVTVKGSSVWISWNAREQINNVMLKTFLSFAKSLHHYFRMKHQSFLTSHFILFTHQKWSEPRLNQCRSRFQNIRPSFNIIRHRPYSAQHRQPSTSGVRHSREGSQSNCEKLR